MTGAAFFVLHWMLHLPSIWRTISKPLLSLGHGVKKEEEADVHKGLRFRVLCALHNIPQVQSSVADGHRREALRR